MNATQHTTRLEHDRKAQTSARLTIAPDQRNTENSLVNLYPQVKYQTLQGFGGAFTDASGYVYSQMPPEARKRLIDAYFGPEGIGYSIGRTHLDSCDFATETYEADGDPADEAFERFSMERPNRYVLPLIQAATAAAGKPIPMLLSPWSPPAYMKTNASRLHGGRLKPEYYGRWARYVCRYIRELKAAGVDVRMLTVQNEAQANQTWDSCLYTAAEERELVRTALGPELRRAGLEDICLLIWDHNRERAFERAVETLADAETDAFVGGVAVHWYSGDHFEALQMLRDRYPGKRLVFTEGCVEYSVVADRSQLRHAEHYAHDLIGNLNHGVDAFLDWNLLLDERGGPNHVGNYCDAPMMYDTQTGELRQNLSFDYIGHFSKYIKPGARRIAYSRWDDALELTAAENPDGTLAVVALNRSEKDVPFVLRVEGNVCEAVQPARSISTYQIER